VREIAPTALPSLGEWWKLPSGRTVSIRRIDGIGFETEITVRYVDEQGAMSTGELHLSIAYVCRGKKVGRD
jgi:hypothetical protein